MPLQGASCAAVTVVVVQLLYTAASTHRAYANNNIQQCCWLSTSFGSSGLTAVETAALVAATLGLAMLACCGPGLLPRQLAVLSCGMVYTRYYMPWYTHVFWVAAVFFCDRLSFLTCVVYGVRHQSYFFVSPPPPPEALVGYVMTGLQIHFLSRLYANTSLQNTYKYWKGVHDFWVWENNFMHTQYQGT